eukprot:7379224-Ditylum_brightwellii.AAC.1
MAFALNQKVFEYKAPGRKWHKAKVKLVMIGGELYMVFHYGDKVHAQSRRSNAWHQAVIVCPHNHGACYTVL